MKQKVVKLNSPRQHRIAVVTILVVAAVFGAGFAATQIGLRGGLSVGALLSLRMMFGAAGLLAIVRAKGIVVDRRSLADGLVLGCILVAIFWLQTDGLRFTTTSKSGLITSLYVPLTPLASLLIRDRIKLSHAVSAMIATAGLYLLVHVPGGLWSGWNRGDFETLLCALLCTAHVTASAHFSRRSNGWVLALLQVSVTGIVSLLVTVFLPSPHGFQNTLAALHNARVLIAVICMVLFNTIFAFWGQSTMQAYLSATEAAVLFSLEPLVALGIGVFWLGEQFSFLQMMGAGLILLAMLCAELLPKWLQQPPWIRKSPSELGAAD